MKKILVLGLFLILLCTNSFAETIYQENWESNDREQWPNLSEVNATIDTSSTQAHSGTYSLKVDITSAAGQASIYKTTQTPTWDTIYVRFWVYLTSTLVGNMDVDNDGTGLLCLSDNTVASLVGIYIIQSSGTDYLMVEYSGGAASLSTSIPSSDTWHCIEVYLYAHDSNGEIKLWVDGVLADSASSEDTLPNSLLVYVLLGNDLYSVGVTGAFYLDDIVIDDENYIGTGWRVQEGLAVGSHYHQ